MCMKCAVLTGSPSKMKKRQLSRATVKASLIRGERVVVEVDLKTYLKCDVKLKSKSLAAVQV